MSAPRSTVQIEFVRQVAEIPDALWDECFPPPHEGRFWYQSLESCGLEDQFAFHYALIRRDGRPVGIAPCFRHDVPIALVAPAAVASVLRWLSRAFPRVGYQRTFFVGSPCSDEGRIGLLPGLALAEFLPELRQAIREQARRNGARMIVFKDFAAEDVPVLTAAAEGATFVSTVSYPGTIVSLPGPDKTAYHRSLTHNQRHNLLKKLRRSAEILALQTSIVTRPSPGERTEIFRLFQQTYERGKTKFERLGPAFFDRISEQSPAKYILQRDAATGDLVAFMLVFHLGDRVVNKFIGLDYQRSGKTFLYFRLFDAALDFAYANGARELQSGQTGYRAKLDLGHRLVPLHNVFRHENPVIHAVFRAVGRRVTWRSLDSDLAAYLDARTRQPLRPK